MYKDKKTGMLKPAPNSKSLYPTKQDWRLKEIQDGLRKIRDAKNG